MKEAGQCDEQVEQSKNGCRCNFFNGNDEALGWAIDTWPRGASVIGNVVFIGTALIYLGKEAAGCATEPPEGETEVPPCLNRVYGIRPSSILTTLLFAVGICSSLLMPIIGTIIDHTDYRRAVGRATAVAQASCTFFSIFVSSKIWFFVCIAQVLSAFLYIAHSLCTFAYLPELTGDKDELNKYTAAFTGIQYSGMLFYLVLMVALQMTLGIADDDVKSAQVSQAVSFSFALVLYTYAWGKLFKPRKASQQVPENQWLVTAGFHKLFNTLREIMLRNKAMKWFILTIALSEAATSSFTTIAVTYTTDQLMFTASENGIAILILLVSSIPGSFISAQVTKRSNSVRSLQICLTLWCTTTFLCSLFLRNPGQQIEAYCFAVAWGICTGWVYPALRLTWCSIIPEGQDAELMGIYLCSSQILGWLPPLVFTAMNEAGVTMYWNVASLCIFFGLAFLVSFLVASDFESAMKRARPTTESESPA